MKALGDFFAGLFCAFGDMTTIGPAWQQSEEYECCRAWLVVSRGHPASCGYCTRPPRIHRQKNRLFVRQTYGSSHTYLVSPTVSTVHTVRAHNVPVHAHCPSALAPRAPANGQLGAQPISMGESCAMQTVRYSRRGARQTDCRMAHRSRANNQHEL